MFALHLTQYACGISIQLSVHWSVLVFEAHVDPGDTREGRLKKRERIGVFPLKRRKKRSVELAMTASGNQNFHWSWKPAHCFLSPSIGKTRSECALEPVREGIISVFQKLLRRIVEKFLSPRTLEEVFHAQVLQSVEVNLFACFH